MSSNTDALRLVFTTSEECSMLYFIDLSALNISPNAKRSKKNSIKETKKSLFHARSENKPYACLQINPHSLWLKSFIFDLMFSCFNLYLDTCG